METDEKEGGIRALRLLLMTCGEAEEEDDGDGEEERPDEKGEEAEAEAEGVTASFPASVSPTFSFSPCLGVKNI